MKLIRDILNYHAEYYDPLTPEKNFYAAVILRAYWDFNDRTHSVRKTARLFFDDRETSKRPVVTFSDCCDALQLDPEIVRKLLNIPKDVNLFDMSNDLRKPKTRTARL